MANTAAEAVAIYRREHPQETVAPSSQGLEDAIAKGASAQQAADAAWSFYQRAEFVDGTPYGSAYAAESLDHGRGQQSQGFGYGMSDEEFNRNFRPSTQLFEGETEEMRREASRPGTSWEESLRIDPYLDPAYRERADAARHSKETGIPANAAARIAALEVAVREIQGKK